MMALQELGKILPDSEKERIKWQAKLLAFLAEGESLGDKIKRKFLAGDGDQSQLKLSALSLIGKIGDQNARDELSRLKLSPKELAQEKEQTLNQIRLRLASN